MSQDKYCLNCGEKLASSSEFCKSCGVPVSTPPAETVPIASRSLRFPLRLEHKLLIGLAIGSVALAVLIPLASAPRQVTTVETQTMMRTNPYLVTSVYYETRTVTTFYTYAYVTTSFYTTTYTMTYYVTTVLYGTVYGGYAGLIPIATIVIPVQVQQIQVQSIVLQQTNTMVGQQTVTETRHTVAQGVSTLVERTMWTKTSFDPSAIVRWYMGNVAWFSIAIVLPILAYHRINAYRTRLHIYYEILNYTSYSSRLPSHIMRACNLETRKFERYITTLVEKGFVNEIPQDGGRLYRTSNKGFDLIRDEKLVQFVRELP